MYILMHIHVQLYMCIYILITNILITIIIVLVIILRKRTRRSSGNEGFRLDGFRGFFLYAYLLQRVHGPK